MNKELELEVKLHLLHLAGGDPDHAQQMLDWLLLPAKNEEDTTIKIEPDAIAALSPAPSEEAGKGEDAAQVDVGGIHTEEERYPFSLSYTLEASGFGGGGYETLVEARADFDRFKADPRYLTVVLKQDGQVLETFARPFQDATSGYMHVVGAGHAPEPVAYFTAQDGCYELRSDGSLTNISEPAQDPLLPPERPPVATPEQLMESGAIDGEAYWLSRKLAKERA